MKVIYNFTNIAPHYRKNLWEKLIVSEKFEMHFFYGVDKYLGIKEIDFSKPPFNLHKNRLHPIKLFWIFRKVLIWQSGVISQCFKASLDSAIFLGEFNIVSTWVAVLICKIRGVKVVYWTHGIYGNESFLKKTIRVFFYKTADKILLYEKRAKKLLTSQGVREDKLQVIYNSLDYDQHLVLRNQLEEVLSFDTINFFQNNTLPYLIFVGRLTKVKKLNLLIEALAKINKYCCKVNLLIVGEGEMKEQLKNQVDNISLNSQVKFFGACFEEKQLASLLYRAELCVSPGNVGLTAIHSLSFGTPVCTHGNLNNQMPEVEAIVDGKTGVFFKENSVASLVIKIESWLDLGVSRKKIRKNCFRVIDDFYNPDNQVSVIVKLFSNEPK
tara:strand:- start:2998 stop:4146 length:1149 start_codon:yes stop_codon:yes gene_type:complete